MRHPLLICLFACCAIANAQAPARALTPAQIAERIKQIEFEDLTKLGVQFGQASCDQNPQRDGWVVRCRIAVKDSQRNEPGLVEIQMWDRNLVFSEMVDGFEKTVAAMTKGSRLSTKPEVKVTTKEGVVTHLDIVCGQAMEPIGLAMCILEPNPRMMMIAATHPASRRTVGTEDMDRSFGAIMAVLTQMQSIARP
jgi:hypothetical protein